MRRIACQRNISVRVLKILLTIVTTASLYCGSLATGQTASSASSNGADDWKQVEAAIAAKRTSLTPEEAKDLAIRAYRFKKERGRLPSISSQDAWERRMAEGAAAFVRFKDEGRYE